MNVRAPLGDQLGPALDFRANQVFHYGAAAHQPGKAWRQVADGAEVLFELRGHGALDRPMAAVVDPRRDLINDGSVARREILDGQHADMT